MHAPTTLKRYEFSKGLKQVLLLLALGGAAAFIITLRNDPNRAWANYLLNYFFWLNIALSGLFFAALQHLTGSYWSATVRRIGEVFIAYLPISLILFIPLFLGRHHIWEWTHADVMAKDHLLSLKSAYLNSPFFLIRHVTLYAVAIFLGGKMVKNSLEQDKAPNPALTLANVKLSAPFIMLFAVFFTFSSIDLIMSLAPHWFSTMYGVYCFAGLFSSGLAMITFFAVRLRKKGVLTDYVTSDHLHDLAKLMFAFMVFWAYVAFSQYMLIWYANLPEETPYMIERTQGVYRNLSIFLTLVKFVIPLFLLVPRQAKRNDNWLLFLTVWFLLAQWVDVYWMVFPAFFKEGPVFGWQEVAFFIGFGSIFMFSVARYLTKVNAVAINDPWIDESLHHHNTPNGY